MNVTMYIGMCDMSWSRKVFILNMQTPFLYLTWESHPCTHAASRNRSQRQCSSQAHQSQRQRHMEGNPGGCSTCQSEM